MGNARIAKSLYEEALASYEKAVSLAPKKGPGSPRPLYLRSSAKAQMGDLKTDMADVNSAVKLEPQNARAHYYQGLLYNKLNNYHKAENAMSKALHYDPYNPEYHYSLALTQYHRASYPKVLESLDALAQLRPDYRKIYSLRAKAHFQLDLVEQALVDANAGLETDPTDVELYILRANLHYNQGESDLAMEDYRLALEVLPNSPELYRNRALLYQKLEKSEQALADIDKAIALDPKNPESFFWKDMLLVQNEQLEAGLASVNQAVEWDETQLEYRLLRANLEIRLGRYEEAQTDIDQVLQKNRANPQAQYLLGYPAYVMGDYKVAEKNMAKAAYRCSNTSDPLLIFNYAQVLVAKGKIEQANTLFHQLLQNEETRAKGHYGKAIIALYKKQYDQAINLFNDAIKQEPRAYIGRGSTFLKLLDYGAALKDFQYYLDHYGYDYQAWRFLGEAQRKLGSLDKAFEKALSYNEKDAESHYGRGMVLLNRENLDSENLNMALADFEKAIKLYDKRAPFYLGRASAKLAKSDVQGALADNKLALRYDSKLAEVYNLQIAIYTQLGDERNVAKAQSEYDTLSSSYY